MSSTPNGRMKIGDFLLRRLKEAGVRHLFGVPGDYNLELLQQLQGSGALKWIGTCSELNASYAADGYARLNGLGALLVTNGVGALNGVGDTKILSYEVYRDHAAFETHRNGQSLAQLREDIAEMVVKLHGTRCAVVD